MGTSKQAGASLVEVMVALFVLAIGLLGILAMQSKSMQFNQSAHIYSQAIYLANDVAERIRNNPSFASSYIIQEAENVVPTKDCEQNACLASELASWDRYQIYNNVSTLLPAGKVSIAQPNVNDKVYRIVISFDDRRSDTVKQTEVAGYDGRRTYALMVGI